MIGKLKEWAGSGIVGSIAFSAFMGFVSYVTGSWWVVWTFAKAHPLESISCASIVLGVGVFIGLAIRHRVAIRQLSDKDDEIQKVIESHAVSFLNLQARQLSAIAYCVKAGGTVSIPFDSELARELQALKRMGYSDTVDGSENSSYWFVTDKTMNALQNSEECRDLLSEAMMTGRFDFWGRYVETSPEVKDRVSGDTGKQ